MAQLDFDILLISAFEILEGLFLEVVKRGKAEEVNGTFKALRSVLINAGASAAIPEFETICREAHFQENITFSQWLEIFFRVRKSQRGAGKVWWRTLHMGKLDGTSIARAMDELDRTLLGGKTPSWKLLENSFRSFSWMRTSVVTTKAYRYIQMQAAEEAKSEPGAPPISLGHFLQAIFHLSRECETCRMLVSARKHGFSAPPPLRAVFALKELDVVRDVSCADLIRDLHWQKGPCAWCSLPVMVFHPHQYDKKKRVMHKTCFMDPPPPLPSLLHAARQPLPESRGTCPVCRQLVLSSQERFKSDDGTYFHMPCAQQSGQNVAPVAMVQGQQVVAPVSRGPAQPKLPASQESDPVLVQASSSAGTVDDSVEDDAGGEEEAGEEEDEAEMKKEDEEQRRAAEQLLKDFIKLPTGRKREGASGAEQKEASEGVDDDRSTAGICRQALAGGGKTYALHGEEGCGKSSTCAHLAYEASAQGLKFVHLHLTEHGRHCNPVSVIRRIVRNLKRALSLAGVEIPHTLADAPRTLNLALRKADEELARADGRGLIVIDGVDRLDDINGLGALAFSWMKRPMPAHLSLVFSYADTKLRWLDFLKDESLPTLVQLRVPVLSTEDGVEMVERYLRINNVDMAQADPNLGPKLEKWLDDVNKYPHSQQPFPDRRRPLMLAMLREELVKLLKPSSVQSAGHAETGEKTSKLLVGQCIDLMKLVLEESAASPWGELFKLVACLIVSTPGGLESRELDQCLVWARGEHLDELERALLQLGHGQPSDQNTLRLLKAQWLSGESAGVGREEVVLEELARFTRAIKRRAQSAGPSASTTHCPVRLGPRNNMVVRAVKKAFMSGDDRGAERRRVVLKLLEGCLAGVLEGFRFQASALNTTTSLPPERRGQILLALPEILQAQAADAQSQSVLEGKQPREELVLQGFLQRLDVFLELYKQENRSQVLRFHRWLHRGSFLHAHALDLAEQVRPHLPAELQRLAVGRPRKAVFSDQLARELSSERGDPVFAMKQYVKVADFLMEAGPVEREGAHAVLIQGLADAGKLVPRLADPITKCKVEAVVVKLLCMLNTLFGRHRYTPANPADGDKPESAQLQTLVLQEAERRAKNLSDGGEKSLLKAEILVGQGYLDGGFGKGNIKEARQKFEEALQILNDGKPWNLKADIGTLTAQMVVSSPAVTTLADTLNALGTAYEWELSKQLEKLKTERTEVDDGKFGAMTKGHLQNRLENESFHTAHRAYQQSLKLGELVCDELVGRAYMSLGKLHFQVDNWDQAADCLSQSVSYYQRGLGFEHVRVALPYHTMAEVLQKQGKLKEAEDQALKALELRRRSFGDMTSAPVRQSKALLEKIRQCRQELLELAASEADKVWAEHRDKNRPLFDGCSSPAAAIQRNKELRVFVSSPFRDFQDERELLVRGVFPELRSLCEQRGVNLVEIDLRTGVTPEQSATGQVLTICLNEVLSCQYFVSMLGNRYGWCKQEEGTDNDFMDETLKTTFDNAVQAFPQFSKMLEKYKDRSITELEIRAAALNCKQEDRPARRLWFHLRAEEYRATDAEFKEPPGAQTQGRLKRLRQAISIFNAEEKPGRAALYASPEHVVNRIKQELLQALEEDLPEQKLSGLEREEWEQTQAAARLLSHWVPLSRSTEEKKATAALRKAEEALSNCEMHRSEAERRVKKIQKGISAAKTDSNDADSDDAGSESIVEKILGDAGGRANQKGSGRKFAIVGRHGSGKSGVCAHLAKEAMAGGLVVHLQLAECSRHSSNPVVVMQRMVSSLARQLKLEGLSVPSSLDKVSQALNLALKEANVKLKASGRKGVIIFDGLHNQDLDKMGLLAFSWMKRPMPSEINLVVAYADDAYADGDDKEKTEMGASRQRGMQRSALEDLLLGFEIVPIALPSAKRCQNMVETMLRHNSKTLSDDQKKLLKEWLEKDDKHRHPLTLSLISEELRSFGIFESLVADTSDLLKDADESVALSSKLLKARIESAAIRRERELESAPTRREMGTGAGTLRGVSRSMSGSFGRTNSSVSPESLGDLLKVVICLVCLTYDGLELDGELTRCLEVSKKYIKHSWRPMDVEFALAQLAPFTRRIWSMPPRLGPRNRGIVEAAEQAFMSGEEAFRRTQTLEVLAETFQVPESAAVTARQAHELPFVLQTQYAMLSTNNDQEGANAVRQKLAAFLQRLDVFLELYKHENADELLRFREIGPETFFKDNKVVYTEALEVSLDLAQTDDEAAEALRSFVKVAKFLQDLVAVVPTEHVAELKGGAYSLLRQGAAEAEELLQVEGGAGQAKFAAVLVTMLCNLNTLYNRHQFRPPHVAPDADDQPPFRLKEGNALLQQADKLLGKLAEGEEKHLLTAQVWEGIGYIYLHGGQCAEALGLIPKKTAVDWFLEELWYLWSSAFTEEEEEKFVRWPGQGGWEKTAMKVVQGTMKGFDQLKQGVGMPSIDRIQAFADALNALGTELERRSEQAEETYFGRRDSAWYRYAEQAYEGSIAMGELLNDAFVGRSCTSLGNFYLKSGSIEKAIKQLEKGKQRYIDGLGTEHVRAAYAHHALAEAYFQNKQLDKAKEAATEAVRLRQKCGDNSLSKSQDLLQKIESEA